MKHAQNTLKAWSKENKKCKFNGYEAVLKGEVFSWLEARLLDSALAIGFE